jgi:hypothetical protein
MQLLQTATDSLNVAEVKRIAYLNPEERVFLTAKTGRPDFASPEQGEIIADMGGVIPVTLAYIDDDIEGSLIVGALTDLIAHYDQGVINFDEVQTEAQAQAAGIRGKLSGRNQDILAKAEAAEVEIPGLDGGRPA